MYIFTFRRVVDLPVCHGQTSEHVVKFRFPPPVVLRISGGRGVFFTTGQRCHRSVRSARADRSSHELQCDREV